MGHCRRDPVSGCVDEVLAVELAQPVQGEQRAGTIAQQPLAPGGVSGRDAHRRIDREAAAVFPLSAVST